MDRAKLDLVAQKRKQEEINELTKRRRLLEEDYNRQCAILDSQMTELKRQC